ncbi:alpha/beta-hydrolase [Marasmius fiardii PR-910]|nr:alpha/beta-hydrolase [Marasmius fiardii PR-910]
MDPVNYKNTTVSRGITYSYYFSPPTTNKRFLVFLHGWPGHSYDWRFQVEYFKEAGYGIIAPDMLGYGGTDKPTDPEVYKSSLISHDIVDILDAESVANNVVVVGHDWGSKIAARLANYFPDRFSAFGFLAVGNFPVEFFTTPYSQLNELTKAVFGYELFGYWDFLSRPGAEDLIESHLESLLSLAHSTDPILWITEFAPLGALEKWLQSDRRAPSTAFTPEEEKRYLELFRIPGVIKASLSWYKVVWSDIEAKDNEGVPEDSKIVTKPVFFGAALRDFVAVAPVMVSGTLGDSANSTIRTYGGGHWVHWESKDQVNPDLHAWLEGLPQ